MSPTDVPLWARGVGALLAIVASWWLVHAVAVAGAIGASVGILGIGIVAASVVRGMGADVGLWPSGSYRSRFSPWLVVATAAAFSAPIAASQVGASEVASQWLDRAMWLTVTAGVVAWGMVVALVRQRPFAPWLLLAVGVAVAPYLTLLGHNDAAQLCIVGADPARTCELPLVRALAFFVPACTAAALVSFEFGFRRLVIGRVNQSGALLVALAAGFAAMWVELVGTDLPVTGPESWVLASAALAAGALYVLSGSLLVSSTYTGVTLGAQLSLAAATDGGSTVTSAAPGGVIDMLHLAVGVAFLMLVWRRHGLLGGVK